MSEFKTPAECKEVARKIRNAVDLVADPNGFWVKFHRSLSTLLSITLIAIAFAFSFFKLALPEAICIGLAPLLIFSAYYLPKMIRWRRHGAAEVAKARKYLEFDS